MRLKCQKLYARQYRHRRAEYRPSRRQRQVPLLDCPRLGWHHFWRTRRPMASSCVWYARWCHPLASSSKKSSFRNVPRCNVSLSQRSVRVLVGRCSRSGGLRAQSSLSPSSMVVVTFDAVLGSSSPFIATSWIMLLLHAAVSRGLRFEGFFLLIDLCWVPSLVDTRLVGRTQVLTGVESVYTDTLSHAHFLSAVVGGTRRGRLAVEPLLNATLERCEAGAS